MLGTRMLLLYRRQSSEQRGMLLGQGGRPEVGPEEGLQQPFRPPHPCLSVTAGHAPSKVPFLEVAVSGGASELQCPSQACGSRGPLEVEAGIRLVKVSCSDMVMRSILYLEVNL